MSIFLLLLGVIVASVGYFIYSHWVDKKLIRADPNRATPAVLYTDRIDFVPTSKYLLFKYQFMSIAGIGPIVGPIIALQWGLIPAFVWLLIGALFFGWLKDYSSCILSLRNEGDNLPALAYKLVSARSKKILVFFIYFYLLLMIAAFVNILSCILADMPNVPFGILVLIIIGLLTGLVNIPKVKIPLLNFTACILCIVGIFFGYLLPIEKTKDTWILFCLIFSYIGAILPVRSYAQPINRIAFYLISLALLFGFLGVILLIPPISAPIFTTYSIEGIGPLWPLLFVIVTCGAVSGWHSLISSSFTSHKISDETDTKYVCGAPMFLEMLFGILVLIIAASSISFSSYLSTLREQGPQAVFTFELARLISFVLPVNLGEIFAGSIFVILGITVLHTITRMLRIVTIELLGAKFPLLGNIHAATISSLILAWILITFSSLNYIWILFGTTNILLATIALFLVFLWLKRMKKTNKFVLIPMSLLLLTGLAALIYISLKLIYVGIFKGELFQLIPASVGIVMLFATLLLIREKIKLLSYRDL